MTTKDDGGPAHPELRSFNSEWASAPGMSLRDYFAGQALSAAIASTDRERWSWAAQRAYAIADAMLEARK